MTTAPATRPLSTPEGEPQHQAGATPTAPDDRRIHRLRATRAEKRTDREHQLALKARRRELDRQDKAARKAQRRAEKAAARADRKARRAERRATHAERDARLKQHALNIARRVMVIGPITAPMAVAWSSQTSYAMTAFGWHLVFALGFAAAWELSTTFTGWMYHQARKHGDRGLEYRLLTWIFATGAAAMNYAHHAGPGGKPTQAAIAFSAMSITGMILWEAYARLVHRQYLRDEGKLPNARPRLGAARWFRYPVHAWTAWSLTIRSADLDTADKAWTAADRVLTDRKTRRTVDRADRAATRSGLTVHRVVVPRVRTADHGPAAIPAVHTVHLAADRTAPTPLTGPADRRTTPALDRGPDREQQTTALPARTTGPDHPAHETGGPDRAVTSGPPALGASPDRADRTTDHPPVDRTATVRATRTGPAAHPGPDRTVDTALVLTDLEQKAVDALRSADRSISKRSICDVVRNELGGSISSDRAVEIARHFRTLRSAA